MAKPYPKEFRDDVVAVARKGLTPLAQIAKAFVVSEDSLTTGWFMTAVYECRDGDATFPRVTIHDLRHTAASLAISAGANVKAVQKMLGHASAAMTLDTYPDLFDDDLDSVSERLDQARARESVGCL